MLDIGYLRMLPNMVIAAPADAFEMKETLALAVQSNLPFAIRYPRDTVPLIENNTASYALGKSAVLRQGDSEYVIVALGPIAAEAMKAAQLLQAQGLSITVVNARFAKPIDPAIIELFAQGKTVITAEDHSIATGFGAAVIEQALAEAHKNSNAAMRAAIGNAVLVGGPDAFIPAAARRRQLEWMGLTAEKLAERILALRH
jgi:1-deoxy-D-xylulose-5-phosphate synthase